MLDDRSNAYVAQAGERTPVPPYSTDTAAAMWLLDRVKAARPQATYSSGPRGYQVDDRNQNLGRGETFPLAVSRAALTVYHRSDKLD
jgi:hypothetical protein